MLKTALIGLGRVGWSFHLPQIAAHPGFEAAAVVDISAERLEEARAKYGVRGYTDYREMLAAEHPDLVVVASPTHLHLAHATDALRAGAHVFLDKPMAASLDEARQIAAVSAETGRRLMVYQPHRVTAEANVARCVLDSGILGPIFMIKRANSGYSRRSDWQSLKKFGGGMLNNYGAHFSDQLLYLCRDTAADIQCHRYRVATLGDADDVVKILMRTPGGVTLDLDINQAAALPLPAWTLCGKYGTAVFDQDAAGNPRFFARYFDPAELAPLSVTEDLAAPGRKYNLDQPIPWKEREFPVTPADAGSFYDACYDYFALGKEPLVPLAESLRVMELIDRCHRLTPDV